MASATKLAAPLAEPVEPDVTIPDDWKRVPESEDPYLAAALKTYRQTGMPAMRQLGLLYPGDGRAAASDDEFLLGDDLLVAPVLEEGATSRSVYLPHGRWVDLWRSARFRSKPGALRLRRAHVLRGGRATHAKAIRAWLALRDLIERPEAADSRPVWRALLSKSSWSR